MSDPNDTDPDAPVLPPAPAPTLDSAICSGTLERLLLTGRVALRGYRAGATIFAEGAAGDAAYFVRSGSVDIVGTGYDGGRRLLNHVRRGEVFGEMALIDRQGRVAAAVAAESCELILIPSDEVASLLREAPELALWLLQQFSHRLRVMTRLATQMEAVQAVNHRILAGQDEERRRIARDIHDGVAQSFVDHILRAQLAQALIETDPERTRSTLEGLEVSLRQGKEQLRDLIYDLYPKELSRVGLVGAIERFVARTAESNSLEVVFDSKGLELSLPPAIESTLYCLVQESLNNIKKHADASEVHLTLGDENGRLLMVVADDGRGFDVGSAGDGEASHTGYGLLSMRERTELAGGHMQLDSRPGGGTRIRFEFPLAV
jgi:signal transduction histidine kinase